MFTFLGIIISTFGIGIMQLILATAMPLIVTEIGGETLYGWVFSSYMLSSLLTIPIFSKLADLFGKKKFYLLGLSLFAIGTSYGALAPDMVNLIVARIIQGLGAGVMTPVSIALISELFPPERRGGMIGAFSFVQLIANLISPIMGSLITKQLGWHWIFYITLAMVLIAIIIIALDKKTIEPSIVKRLRWTEIDLFGGVLFGLFCVLIVTFSDSFSKLGRFELTGVSLLIGAIITGLILLWNESRHIDPVIKFEFFKVRVLRQSIFSSIIAGSIMYGLVTLLPLCSVIFSKYGYITEESQLLMIFMIGTTFGVLVTSRIINRLDSRFPKFIWGLSLICAGVMYFSVSSSLFLLFNILTGLLGLSLGAIMATLLINSQNAVNNEDRTVLSGLVQLGRYLGASVGVTVLTGFLPEISQISNASQILGTFGLLVGIYVLGLINELC